MAKNRSAPARVRQQPEIFCCSLIIRRSRSERLLSSGARKSCANRNTSSSRSSRRKSRFSALVRLSLRSVLAVRSGSRDRLDVAGDVVAVGTAVAGRPPHRSQRALLTHWAPGLDTGVESRVWPGVCDRGWREPSVGEAVHPLPVQPPVVLLIAKLDHRPVAGVKLPERLPGKPFARSRRPRPRPSPSGRGIG
jgi:hypothetical protein